MNISYKITFLIFYFCCDVFGLSFGSSCVFENYVSAWKDLYIGQLKPNNSIDKKCWGGADPAAGQVTEGEGTSGGEEGGQKNIPEGCGVSVTAPVYQTL